MEVSFYHLSSTPIEKAVPILLEKAYEGGHRCMVLAKEQDIDAFDKTLWTFHPRKFLPHGTKNPEKQPIFITSKNDNQNNATVIAVVNAEVIDMNGFEKILDIFDGNVEADLSAARARWKSYKEQGANLRYWFQDEKGKWLEKQI
ncbi:MAG: DNA polymerase III subunit chi [Alphaproteobacteria bacterium CG11_big_fil_rev_8_21_14_0_20_44_7]|nr:MAG: DNA polymerase III subunit chi [Alphaproteobacteria bacterium CG11_big_fil_rev_8_21_14_0_20_44_7]